MFNRIWKEDEVLPIEELAYLKLTGVIDE